MTRDFLDKLKTCGIMVLFARCVMKDLVWKDVVGFEGFYKVSENGDIKSLERYDEYINRGKVCLRHRKEKILTPKLNRGGYLVYHLRDASRDIECWPTSHRLVALSFVDNVENKPYIDHKDGVKTNNHYTNLEWCTAQENTQHAYDTGLAKSVIYRYAKRGEDNHNAVLKKEDIPEIKRKRAEGMTYKAIGEQYGVCLSAIFSVCKGESWRLNE